MVEKRGTVMSAREEILEKIRSALPGEAADPEQSYGRIPRDYRSSEGLSPDACVEHFLDRLLDYNAEILHAATEGEIAGVVEQAMTHAGEHSLVVAKELPSAWIPAGLDVRHDAGLSTAQIEGVDAVLTTCEIAVASTGTIFLVHDGAQGRRVLTLLPDHHLCGVRRGQVVGTVPEAVRALGPRLGRAVTTISGPSATSDIEMTRIRGVHGPRQLTVILCAE
jgi:L-lactate dehydrogenase complex protein LldG